MAILFPFPSSKARVRAMSSANWAEVPGGRGLASMVSKLETTAQLALLFPSKTKLLPSVYQISSGLVKVYSDNASRGFAQCAQGFQTRVKGERALGGRQEGGWVKNLTRGYNEARIFHQHYLVSEDSLIRNPQMASQIQEFFTWWLVKIVNLSPKESFKASSIRIAKAARF